jgi:hypothetical protein
MPDLYRKVGDMEYDGLFTDSTPPRQVAGGVIAKLFVAAAYVRGTILAKAISNGKLYVLGTVGSSVHTDFTGDGTVKSFTISGKPAKLTSVTVKAVAVTEGTDFTYNPGTGVIAFGTAPGDDEAVVCNYAEQLIPDSVLCDDTAIGTAADVNAAVYTAGCFDSGKLTAETGYTITTADKDALRTRGIVLKSAMAEN